MTLLIKEAITAIGAPFIGKLIPPFFAAFHAHETVGRGDARILEDDCEGERSADTVAIIDGITLGIDATDCSGIPD